MKKVTSKSQIFEDNLGEEAFLGFVCAAEGRKLTTVRERAMNDKRKVKTD
jgi:hypothetical protein